jgi:ADP-ribose pyrophosphatase YjhB (NUDIX family)
MPKVKYHFNTHTLKYERVIVSWKKRLFRLLSWLASAVVFGAVIMVLAYNLLDDEGRVLLARRAFEPDAGLWDVPGGFLEEGEHPLDGLRRELAEETGVDAEPGAFLGVFMDTYGDAPEANAVLNLVWEARVSTGELVPADDVSELRWFPPGAFPPDEELAFRWIAPALRAWFPGL